MNYFRVGRWQPASGVKLGVRVMDRRIRGHLSIETGKITAFFRLVEAMCNTHTVLVCGSTYVLLFVRSFTFAFRYSPSRDFYCRFTVRSLSPCVHDQRWSFLRTAIMILTLKRSLLCVLHPSIEWIPCWNRLHVHPSSLWNSSKNWSHSFKFLDMRFAVSIGIV